MKATILSPIWKTCKEIQFSKFACYSLCTIWKSKELNSWMYYALVCKRGSLGIRVNLLKEQYAKKQRHNPATNRPGGTYGGWLGLWRQNLVRRITTSRIPPHVSFPINTPFNNASLLSRYPRVKQSTTTAHARTHDTLWFLVLLFLINTCFM